jgi:hypothetical protein
MTSGEEKPKNLFEKYLEFAKEEGKFDSVLQKEEKFEKMEKTFSTIEPSISSQTQSIDSKMIFFINDMFKRFFLQKNYNVDFTKLPHTEIHLDNRIRRIINGTPSEIDKNKTISSEFGVKIFNMDCEDFLIQSGKGSQIISNTNHMESVWWGFKTLYEKNLIKMNKKLSSYCVDCEKSCKIDIYNNYKNSKRLTCNWKFNFESQMW